jgi:alginate O-acetyltransferase complex protein AlgI
MIYIKSKSIETKNTVLIVFSLIFYAWGEPSYIIILLFMAYFDWYISGFIEKHRQTGLGKLLLIVALAVDISLLAFFKYGTFFTSNLHALTGFPQNVINITLPIGISFYTFQLISYLVDVYRGEVEAQPIFRRLLLYVCLFHQCIAGPIVRYKDISEQIISRRVGVDDVRNGINRFTSGLAKKVLLANICGKIASGILLGGAADATGAVYTQLKATPALSLWIGCFAYMLQIYLDFSAYSDMAIGMGLMVGFKYKENFDYPYLSGSITEFWRRWHMSLSSFFRDYVYIPLGGNRKGVKRQIVNLFVVWLLTGMWHGAGWNFILWGLYYFAFLVLEKFFLAKKLETLPKAVNHIYTLAVVFFGWILFYFMDMSQIGIVVAGLFGLNGNGFADFAATATLTNYSFFLLAAVIACTPVPRNIFKKIVSMGNPIVCKFGVVLETVLPVLAVVISISFLVSDSYNPFLYLQF